MKKKIEKIKIPKKDWRLSRINQIAEGEKPITLEDIAIKINEIVEFINNLSDENYKNWFAGFVDGEGCFHIRISKGTSYKLGFQVTPMFKLELRYNYLDILRDIQKYFGFGKTYIGKRYLKIDKQKKRSKSAILWVTKFSEIYNKLNPILENRLIIKRNDFSYWTKIIELINQKKHLTKEGIIEIDKLRRKMNNFKGTKPKIIDYLNEKEKTN